MDCVQSCKVGIFLTDLTAQGLIHPLSVITIQCNIDLFRAKSITQFERSNLFVGYILFGSCRIACKDRVEERRAGKISCIDKYIVVVIELIVKTTLHAPRQKILKAGHSVQFIRTRGRVS